MASLLTTTARERPPNAPHEQPRVGSPPTSAILTLGPIALLWALALPSLVSRDLWLDEGYSLAATRDLSGSLVGEHGTMGLYYVLLDGWAFVSDSGIWLRSLSLLCMTGALALFVPLVRRVSGAQTAAWAGVFAAASFMAVRYAHEARSYALVALLTVASWSALTRAAEAPHRRAPWRVFWLCCALLPLAHGLAAIQVAVQVGVAWASGLPRRVRRGVMAGGLASLVTLASLAAAGVGTEGAWVDDLSWDGIRTLLLRFSHPLPVIALILGGLIGAAAWWDLGRARRAAPGPMRFHALIPTAWGLLTLATVLGLSLIRPFQVPRYSVASLFGLAWLLAVGVRAVDRRMLTTRLPVAGIVVVAALLVGQLAQPVGEGGWSRAVEQISKAARPGDAIVFPTDDVRIPFEAEWRTVTRAPSLNLIGTEAPLGTVDRYGPDASVSELAGASEGEQRIWAVNQPYAHTPDRSDEYLSLIADDYGIADVWRYTGSVTVTLLRRR